MISNNEFDDWDQSTPSVNPDGQAGGVDLMQVAMRRKGLIALGVFVGLCLGLLYFARAIPKYESVAILSILDKASTIKSTGNMQDAFATVTPAEVHASRITTFRILNDALSLNQDELKKLESLKGVDNKVKEIFDGLTIQPVQKGSEDLALSYRGTNPDDCAVVLDAVMESYTEFLQATRKNKGAEVKQWITEEHDKRLTALQLKSEEHEKWRKSSELFIMDDNGLNVHQQRIAKYEDAKLQQQMKNDELSVQIDNIEEGIKDKLSSRALLGVAKSRYSLPQDGRDRILETERLRILFSRESASSMRAVPLMMEDQRLQEQYGDDHPRRKSIQRQIELAEGIHERESESMSEYQLSDDSERVQQELLDYVALLKQDLRAGVNLISSLEAQINRERELGKKMAVDSARYRTDTEQIGLLREAYNDVQAKVREVKMADAFGGDNKFSITRLQDPGIGRKVEPSLAKSLAAGSMLGFLAGFGLGYLVEMFDKTFRDPQEVSKMLQLPMIGHIPEITTEPVDGSKLSEVLIAFHQPKSPLAENFRAIRTALYFSTAGQQTRVIQTTSPVPGDGKSTLTANLAVTIAQSNKSVLLLDADFRRPTQHKLFGVTNDVGLASVVADDLDPSQAVQATEVPNLHIMSCGKRPHNPSELLTSPNFADLLNVLREQYDFVLVDTPPVLAVTDPGIVSARVDGVIMALRIRKNGRPGAMRARKILQELDANMLGIVVNGIDQRSGSYGYYSNYRKGYGYNYTYKYGYGQDPTEQEIGKYYEEPAKMEEARSS